MNSRRLRPATALLLLCLLIMPAGSSATAYNARPKLVVIIIIDQFRADYLTRFHDEFGEGGFRMFTDRGADFTDCYYDYATTRTAPGHATLGTGAYSDGHGIGGNTWWDPQRKQPVSSVQDERYKIVGVANGGEGTSFKNLMASTLGDELRLSTSGKSRVYGLALKDRAAMLPVGPSANGAFWIDHKDGDFVTSSYFMAELPAWAQKFNASKSGEKYWDREWKDASGRTLRTTNREGKGREGKADFYDVVGSTPYGNDHLIDFAEQLITNEKLGAGETTDLLTISFSSFDILGHKAGPNSDEMHSMTLALDRQLAGLFRFLDAKVGMKNVWVALSADHGVAPMPEFAQSLRVAGTRVAEEQLVAPLNKEINARISPGKDAQYVKFIEYPTLYLDVPAFAMANVNEADAERIAGEALVKLGASRTFFTKSQLASGNVPQTQVARRYAHSYAAERSWYAMGVPAPYVIPYKSGTDHYSPYNYDAHVPLAFFGSAFRPGTYRTHAEPVDMASTLASLLGVNRPSHAVGRVLTEAVVDQQPGAHATASQDAASPKAAPARRKAAAR